MFFPLYDDNPTRRTAVVTYGIIAINVLVFVWLIRQPPAERESIVLHRGFIPDRISQLSNPRPLVITQRQLVHHQILGFGVRQRQLTLAPDRGEILLSLVTCLFLHGGWMHLIGNMWFLWIFGTNVEDRLGHAAFFFFYLVGGLLATGLHWAISPDGMSPIIGASGAIAAVLGAYAITWPWARVHTLVFLVIFITIIEVPALVVLGVWFLVQLMEGHAELSLHASGGVAWWAHVGGFLAGLVMMPLLCMLLGKNESDPPDQTVVEVVAENNQPW